MTAPTIEPAGQPDEAARELAGLGWPSDPSMVSRETSLEGAQLAGQPDEAARTLAGLGWPE